MLVVYGVLIGVGATVLMDLWALLLSRFAGQNPPNWRPAGRWTRYLAEGKVFHDDIGAVPPYEHENALGWLLHYGVGVIYGVVFALIMGPEWFAAPTFVPAWVFAILTISAGWFLLQPGMGLGWAASKTANPKKVRLMGLVAHTVFGLGLWGTALLLV